MYSCFLVQPGDSDTSSSLSEFGVDRYTLARWSQDSSRMDRLLQRVEKLTIYILREAYVTPATVRQLHLLIVRELCLEKHPYIDWGAVKDYSSLCDMILQSFPAHLIKVTFTDLMIRNTNAALILRLLRTDNHLKTIRYISYVLILLNLNAQCMYKTMHGQACSM